MSPRPMLIFCLVSQFDITAPLSISDPVPAVVTTATTGSTLRTRVRSSITLVRGEEMLPLRKGNGLFISTPPITLIIVDEKIDAGNTFATAAAEYFSGVAREISLEPSDEQIESLCREAADKDYVVLGTYNAYCNPAQQKLQQALLKANPNLISVALRASYDSDCSRDVPCYLLTYEYTEHSIRSLLRVLSGERTPEGLPPLAL